jgi:FkbM family methyltransferase
MNVRKLKNSCKYIYKDFIFSFAVNCNCIVKIIIKLFYKPKLGTVEFIINEFSKNNPKLTVIQVGANDGFNNDPIYKFIQRDSWKGILIEPQKHTYSKYLQRLYKNSKHIIPVNAAISNEDGEMTLYRISFCNERWATGLATFDKDGLMKMVNDGNIDRRAFKYGITVPKNKEEYIMSETVKVLSPTSLANIYGITQFDFLMVDTEGYDFEILKMFFKVKLTPSLLVFEQMHFSTEELNECHNLLKNNNYKFKQIKGNTIALLDNVNNANLIKEYLS